MKNTIETLKTVCAAFILLVSGVAAQNAAQAPTTDQGSQDVKNAHESLSRVSIMDYVKALETIQAFNALHNGKTALPGITRVQLRPAPETSYKSLIASKLRVWDSLRIDDFQREHRVNVFAGVKTKLTHSDWHRQEFLNDFSLDRLVSDQSVFSLAGISDPITYSSPLPRSK